MKIVIWKGHGEIEAYAVDTVSQINGVKAIVWAIVKDNYPTSLVNILRDKCNTIQGIVAWVNCHCEGDDSFERFELTNVMNV